MHKTQRIDFTQASLNKETQRNCSHDMKTWKILRAHLCITHDERNGVCRKGCDGLSCGSPRGDRSERRERDAPGMLYSDGWNASEAWPTWSQFLEQACGQVLRQWLKNFYQDWRHDDLEMSFLCHGFLKINYKGSITKY